MQGFIVGADSEIRRAGITVQPGAEPPESFSPHSFESLESIYALAPPTVCAMCGDCCSSNKVLCYSVEFFHIMDHIKTQRRELVKPLAIQLGARLMQRREKVHAPILPCVFWDSGSGRCLIYSHRPLICRTYGIGKLIEHTPSCGKGLTSACEKLSWKSPESALLTCRDLAMAFSEIRSLSPYLVRERTDFLARAHALEVWMTLGLVAPDDDSILDLFDMY